MRGRGLRIVRAIVATRERQLFAIALLVRLLPAALIYGTEDVRGWEAMGCALAEGRNPYPTNYVSWPPFWLPWTMASWMVSSALNLPFYFVVKLLPIAADIILTFVLYSAAKAYGRKPFATALAYALNPIAIYTSAIHGQFDSIPALCTTLAVLLTRRETRDWEWHSAGTWLGVGAAFKTWPLFVLPAVLAPLRKLRHKAGLAAIAMGIFVGAVFLQWPFAGRRAVTDVLRYRSATGWWGLASLHVLNDSFGLSADSLMWLFYVAMAAAGLLVLLAKPRATDGALLMLLTFLAFTPGFGIQYLVWVIAVALLADQRRAILYSILGGVLIAVEAFARPYAGHLGDTIRLLPHVGFARAYGGGLDQIYAIGGRLALWAFVCYWWIVWLGRSLHVARKRSVSSERVQRSDEATQ